MKLAFNISAPIALLNQGKPNFDLIHRQLESSLSMSTLFKRMQEGDDIGNILIKREKSLSVATMSSESIKLLYKVAKEKDVDDLAGRVIQHSPSITAGEKQAILKDFQIQKTITILIQNKFVLCSGIGDFKVNRKLLSEMATLVGCSRSTFDSYINPAMFVPEIELGLLRGMVSTFFSPGRITQLSLVGLIEGVNESKDVAVSLSPFESLILPGRVFVDIVKEYAECAYPYLNFSIL